MTISEVLFEFYSVLRPSASIILPAANLGNQIVAFFFTRKSAFAAACKTYSITPLQ
jgi:hypothetical protein